MATIPKFWHGPKKYRLKFYHIKFYTVKAIKYSYPGYYKIQATPALIGGITTGEPGALTDERQHHFAIGHRPLDQPAELDHSTQDGIDLHRAAALQILQH